MRRISGEFWTVSTNQWPGSPKADAKITPAGDLEPMRDMQKLIMSLITLKARRMNTMTGLRKYFLSAGACPTNGMSSR